MLNLSDNLMKWQFDKTTSWLNDYFMIWQVDEMTSWWNDKLLKWLVDEMTVDEIMSSWITRFWND